MNVRPLFGMNSRRLDSKRGNAGEVPKPLRDLRRALARHALNGAYYVDTGEPTATAARLSDPETAMRSRATLRCGSSEALNYWRNLTPEQITEMDAVMDALFSMAPAELLHEARAALGYGPNANLPQSQTSYLAFES